MSISSKSLDWLATAVENKNLGVYQFEEFTDDMQIALLHLKNTEINSKLAPKTVSAKSVIANYGPMICFSLGRRPSTVLFAVWQKMLRQNDENYHSYYQHRKVLFTRFIRSHLFLYRLAKAFRNVLQLPVYANSGKQIKLPHNIRSFLINFSSPNTILKSIADFTEGLPLQIGISYVRSLEKFSSEVSSSGENGSIDPVDYLRSSIEGFLDKTNRLRDKDFILTEELPEVNEPTYENLKDNLSSSILMYIPQLLGRDQRDLRNINKVSDSQKRELMVAYRDFPIWFRIKKIAFQGVETHKYPFQEYFLCCTHNQYIIASRVKVADHHKWHQHAKYFEYFENYEQAMQRFYLIKQQKLDKGLDITRETR